jgi:ADP-ribose pyrophosphatase YjhB (NUDIX family)
MAYNNPTPVAVAVARVRRNDGSLSLLGIVRKLAPVDGQAFGGGFVNEMETTRAAVAREFWEETRFVTDVSQWRLLDEAITPRNQLLVFCEFKYEIPEASLAAFVPTKEVSAIFCITPETELCFPLHQEVARAYLRQVGPAHYPELSPEMDMSPEL